jgi:hypothetical protein
MPAASSAARAADVAQPSLQPVAAPKPAEAIPPVAARKPVEASQPVAARKPAEASQPRPTIAPRPNTPVAVKASSASTGVSPALRAAPRPPPPRQVAEDAAEENDAPEEARDSDAAAQSYIITNSTPLTPPPNTPLPVQPPPAPTAGPDPDAYLREQIAKAQSTGGEGE